MDTTQRNKLLNAAIYFLKNTKTCGKTKLFKLLYYLDFLHFRETGRSVTGLDYSAWQFGPYPETFAKDINNPPEDVSKTLLIRESGKFTDIKPRKAFDPSWFSRRELRIMERVAFIFKDANTELMVESTHLPNHPWDKTLHDKGEKAIIDYMLALDDKPGSLLPEEVLERIQDKEALRDLLAA